MVDYHSSLLHIKIRTWINNDGYRHVELNFKDRGLLESKLLNSSTLEMKDYKFEKE